MDSLAKKGKTGLMYTVKKGFAPESDVAAISILGYDPFQYGTGRGVFEALGAGLSMKDGDLALRCNFATLGNDKKIIDRRVGRDLTSQEAGELSKAINRKVELESHPAEFEFKNTIGYRAALVIKSRNLSLSSKITNTDPAYSRKENLGVANPEGKMFLNECQPLNDSEKSKISADLVNEFVKKGRSILKRHEINKNRTEKGELEANVTITRDAGHLLPKFYDITKKYGLNFVSLTDMPVERGISKSAGMDTVVLPPPSGDIKSELEVRRNKLLSLLSSYDCFYIHLKGPDEPGHDGDFELKKNLISMIDEHFLGKLLEKIGSENPIICVTSDHSTPCKVKAHTDDPVPLLISGKGVQGDSAQKFSEKECEKGSLGVLDRGTELMPKLIKFLKESD